VGTTYRNTGAGLHPLFRHPGRSACPQLANHLHSLQAVLPAHLQVKSGMHNSRREGSIIRFLIMVLPIKCSYPGFVCVWILNACLPGYISYLIGKWAGRPARRYAFHTLKASEQAGLPAIYFESF